MMRGEAQRPSALAGGTRVTCITGFLGWTRRGELMGELGEGLAACGVKLHVDLSPPSN